MLFNMLAKQLCWNNSFVKNVGSSSNWIIDFKNIRRAIAPRVRAVLNIIITNNNLK